MDQETSQKVVGIIAGVLISDDNIHPHEARFLQRMRERFGLEKGTAVEPIGTSDEATAALRGLPADVQKETLGLVVEAAAVDGHIAIGERIFLDAMAKELGVSGEDVEIMLQKAITASKPQPFEPAAEQAD